MSDKAEAIASLLGLIFYHLGEVPGAMKTARQEWVSEKSHLDPPPQPPAVYDHNCEGACVTCLKAYAERGKKPVCPPDEMWIRERDQLLRTYRIADVYASLLRLSTHCSGLAQAVWAKYVEPWPDPKTEPMSAKAIEQRDKCAALGIAWMVEDIPGEVTAPGMVDDADNRVRVFLADHPNASDARVMKQCGVGNARVKRIREQCEVREGCAV